MYIPSGGGGGASYHKPDTYFDTKILYDHHLGKQKGPVQSKRYE